MSPEMAVLGAALISALGGILWQLVALKADNRDRLEDLDRRLDKRITELQDENTRQHDEGRKRINRVRSDVRTVAKKVGAVEAKVDAHLANHHHHT